MAARVFRVEFRSAVAQRILNGESVSALHAEFEIKRSVLYRWRDAYRKSGQSGFKRPEGDRRGSARQLDRLLGRPLRIGASPN